MFGSVSSLALNPGRAACCESWVRDWLGQIFLTSRVAVIHITEG